MISSESGLSLVELLAVIVILGILASIAVPIYFAHVDRAEHEVCSVNRNTLSKNYELELMFSDRIHSEVVFQEFLQMGSMDVCPVGGIYSYSDGGEIQCSRHADSDDDEEDEGDKEVPWL